ncbi:MAG TPA: N-succinylarginine dihydrolase [Tepidisphaeraceae bacterium]|nr:N-succinylarginine dihydrolase [Tepidisphaeraceae bacterium]
MPLAHEVNFDGLVGPTHNYAGLAYGNLASTKNRNTISHPRAAALEGLAKMKFLMDLGLKQAVLPPQERPDVMTLRRLGFAGSDAQILEKAAREAPMLLASCSSASSMWAANAATVSPSSDTSDGRVHFTPANLASQLHRSLEAKEISRILRAIFQEESAFAHHDPLPAAPALGDEGAANHTRLASEYGDAGLEIFTYGRSASGDLPIPKRFPARQSLEASAAVARLHQADARRLIFVQQNPIAIDAGAFHNDVVAVGNLNVLLYHQAAYADARAFTVEVKTKFASLAEIEPILIEVSESEVPLAEAISSYLFNSQLVSLPDGSMALICPTECRETTSAWAFLDRLTEMETPIKSVHFVDVRQSMKNGGGPACLRLRVVLNDSEIQQTAQGVFLTAELFEKLIAWVNRHYRESLAPADLADSHLLTESRTALDELTKLLGLGTLYDFQQT